MLSANVKGVFIWDLLSLRLIGQFQTENSKLYANQEKEELILSCKDGLFDIDGTLNTVKICSVNYIQFDYKDSNIKKAFILDI